MAKPAPNPSYTFTTPLWEMQVAAAWVFVSLPREASDAIKAVRAAAGAEIGDSVEVTVETLE